MREAFDYDEVPEEVLQWVFSQEEQAPETNNQSKERKTLLDSIGQVSLPTQLKESRDFSKGRKT
jgi:hypothetical protein